MTMGKVGEYNPILEKRVIKKDPEHPLVCAGKPDRCGWRCRSCARFCIAASEHSLPSLVVMADSATFLFPIPFRAQTLTIIVSTQQLEHGVYGINFVGSSLVSILNNSSLNHLNSNALFSASTP